MTKIDIISGFLGAGKTTFIKKLIKESLAGEKVVLIENEFGEIGIDGGFLKDAGIEIREMNSGCICCSLVGDFGRSLNEVITKYAPDRVIIEPSGVGKLSDVMNAVLGVAKDLDVELSSAVTVVDAAKCRMYMKNFGEFFNDQVSAAGTIILSRTDVTPAAKINAALELLREKNAEAAIVTTPLKDLDGAEILKLMEKPDRMMEELMKEVEEHHHHDDDDDDDDHECCHHHHHDDDDDDDDHECCHHHHHDDDDDDDDHECCHHHHHDDDDDDDDHECCHHHHHDDDDHDHECCHHHDHHHHHHHADEVFSSWGMENAAAVDEAELKEILEKLAYTDAFGQVLRAKGMLQDKNGQGWLHFDLVPEEVEIRRGPAEYTGKVCVIGAALKEDKLKEIFGRK